MAYSTIEVTVYVLDQPVLLEVEVVWSTCPTDGAVIIDDFMAYHVSDDEPQRRSSFERIPYWMHKILEESGELYEYSELIEDKGE